MTARSQCLRRAAALSRELTSPGAAADHERSEPMIRRSIVGALATALFGPERTRRFRTPSARSGIADAVANRLMESARAAADEHQHRVPSCTNQSACADIIAAVHERLARPDGIGVHYTSPDIAEYMANAAISEFLASRFGIDRSLAARIMSSNSTIELDHGTAESALHAIRSMIICDPACGAGHLLTASANAVEHAERRLQAIAGTTLDTIAGIRQRIATRQIHGYDIDDDAVAIAQLRLSFWESSNAAARSPSGNIRVRDTLAELPQTGAADASFDIVIMNPPYVPTYSRQSRSDLRTPIREFARSRGMKGRLNLFGCFIIRSLELTKKGGVLSLIVPDTFASAGAYESLRCACVDQFGRQNWTRVDARVFKAHVGSVILTCSNDGDALAATSIREAPECDSRLTSLVEAILVAERGDEQRILFFEDAIERSIWKIVRQMGRQSLASIARIRDGVNTGPRRMRDILLDPAAPSIFRRPLIEGADVHAHGFLLHDPTRTILYNPTIVDDAAKSAGTSLRDPDIFDAPKIFSRQTADTIIAAIEPAGGIVSLNSVHCIQLTSGSVKNLPGLVAFLNSPLIRLYYAIDGGEQRSVLPQVRIAWLRQLPVPRQMDTLLESLTPIATACIEKLRRRESVDACIAAIHQHVCNAFRVPPPIHTAAFDRYLNRFPRFAEQASHARRRTKVRVA